MRELVEETRVSIVGPGVVVIEQLDHIFDEEAPERMAGITSIEALQIEGVA